MRKTIIIIIAIAIVAFLVINKIRSSTKESKSKVVMTPAMMKNMPVQVSAYVVKTINLDNNIKAAGSVLANESVDLRAEASGRITHIYFKEGSRVKKGQLLVKINDADLQATLLKQKYQLQVSTKEEGREKQLLAKGGVSQAEYDIALSTMNSNKADIEMTEAQIAKTEIRAPFDGKIGLKSVSEGSYISPTVPVASMQQIEPIKIDFSIPEQYMEQVAVGDNFTFKVQGSQNTFSGKIFAIEPKIDPSTRNVLIRGICDNKNDEVLPGAFAEVHLVLKKIPNAIMVPTQAIVPQLKSQMVYLARNGKAMPQPVQLGLRNDTAVQVTSGLQAGDTVLTTGVLALHPQAHIKLTSVVK